MSTNRYRQFVPNMTQTCQSDTQGGMSTTRPTQKMASCACLRREPHSIKTEVLKERTASTFVVTFWFVWLPTGKSTEQLPCECLWRQRAAGRSEGEHGDRLAELSVASPSVCQNNGRYTLPYFASPPNFCCNKEAVPLLRRPVAGLLLRRSGFDPGSVHVRFVVEKVAMRQVFLRVLPVRRVSINPLMLHAHFHPIRRTSGQKHSHAGCPVASVTVCFLFRLSLG